MYTALLLLLLCVLPDDGLLEPYRQAAAEWEDEVAELTGRNAPEVAGPDDVLFVGSSSIRLWDSIAEDMSPWSTVRRGYGGAKYSDVAVYLDRLLAGHQPKAVVYFAANDIANNPEKDKTPQQVAALAEYIVRFTRDKMPETPIFFIELTTTPSRFAVQEKIAEANKLIQQVAAAHPQCYFIPTKDLICDASGIPKDELFRDDRLHLSAAGYDLWATRIKAALSKHLSP